MVGKCFGGRMTTFTIGYMCLSWTLNWYILNGIYFCEGVPMTQHIAKIFMNGRSQAIRLPKEFRFEGDEVYIRKIGNDIVISSKKPSWDEFFNQKPAFDNDFLSDREDTSAQERDFF